MKKYIYFLICLSFLLPIGLQAKYQYSETVFVPLPEKEIESWILGYQNVKENGLAITRYVLQTEEGKDWTKILNIHFKDKQHTTATTALEAMEQERILSPDAQSRLISHNINDCLYERSFPTGEHEIVRMIMTKKGLHRIAYIKRGNFDEKEKRDWISRLMSGVVGQ